MNNKEMPDPEEFTTSLPPEHEDAQAMLDETRKAAREAEESGETARIQAGIEGRKAIEKAEKIAALQRELGYLRQNEKALLEIGDSKEEAGEESYSGPGDERGEAAAMRRETQVGDPEKIKEDLERTRTKIAEVEGEIKELEK